MFLEALDPKRPRQAKICERYLRRIDKVYRGVVSVPVLGEYVKVILEKPMGDVFDVFSFLIRYMKFTNVRIVTPDIKTLRKFDDIMNWKIDKRIGSMDRLHLACAGVEEVDNFVTIERSILRNKILAELLGIKVTHPKNHI